MGLPVLTHPEFDVKIPTSGETIKLRPMTVREEKVLLTAREGGEPAEIFSAIAQVVQQCAVKPLSLDKLAMADLQYLFINLRARSVSDKVKVSYTDNEEEAQRRETEEKLRANGKPIPAVDPKATTYDFDIDLTKVEVKFPEKSEKDIKVSDKVGIVMRYPPASLYNNKEFLNSTGEKAFDMLVQNSIDKIYDGTNVTEIANGKAPITLKAWVDDLDLKTYEKINEFLNNQPTLYHEITYTNKLGHERKIVLSALTDFFSL